MRPQSGPCLLNIHAVRYFLSHLLAAVIQDVLVPYKPARTVAQTLYTTHVPAVKNLKLVSQGQCDQSQAGAWLISVTRTCCVVFAGVHVRHQGRARLLPQQVCAHRGAYARAGGAEGASVRPMSRFACTVYMPEALLVACACAHCVCRGVSCFENNNKLEQSRLWRHAEQRVIAGDEQVMKVGMHDAARLRQMLFRGAFSVGNPSGGFFFTPFDFTVKGIANTSVVAFGGKILALYEVSAAGSARMNCLKDEYHLDSVFCACLCAALVSAPQLLVILHAMLYTEQRHMLTCGCARRSATCHTRWTRSCGLLARPTWAAASTPPKSARRTLEQIKLRLALWMSCACIRRQSRPAHAGLWRASSVVACSCGAPVVTSCCARGQVLRRAPPRGAGRRRPGAPGRLQLLRGAHRRAGELLRVRARRLPAAEQGHASAGGAPRGGPAAPHAHRDRAAACVRTQVLPAVDLAQVLCHTW